MRVAGVDGTRGGWVAIVLEGGEFVTDRVLRPVQTNFAELGDVEIIAIDVPIGFGPRLADSAARRYLSGAASTVFSTPSRAVLEVPFGPGLGVSAQAHALGDRILWISDLARRDQRIREVHPEVSFRAMNGGVPLKFRKKSSGGALERIELLRRNGIAIEELGEAAACPLDDVLDAAAAAWSGHRIARDRAQSLPTPPELLDGLPTAIWF